MKHNQIFTGQNSDTSKVYMSNKEYLKAVNFRPTTTTGESNGSLVNVDGNEMIVYPNPTTGVITLAFSVAKTTKANLGVYDLNGKKCIDVISDNFPKGKYSYTIDLGDVVAGTYVAVLSPDANQQLIAEKIIKQ